MSSPQCAAAIVAQLLAQGVRDVVLAPGSRSAPLALALARAESSGSLRLHVRYDERSAGFLALGDDLQGDGIYSASVLLDLSQENDYQYY